MLGTIVYSRLWLVACSLWPVACCWLRELGTIRSALAELWG